MPTTSFWSSLTVMPSSRNKNHVNAFAFATTVLLLGCPSPSLYRTADPVPVGRWQAAAALGAGAMRDQDQTSPFPTAHLELGARYGLAENLDVGAKIFTPGLQLDATWRVLQGTWSWAIAPSVAVSRTHHTNVTVDAFYLFAGSALIASRPLSPHWKIGLGPLFGWGMFRPHTSGSAHGGWLGGFIHVDALMNDTWHLTPEISAYRVVVGEVPVAGGAIRAGLALRHDF